MTIGQRIRQRRIELELSQGDVAKKVGYKSRSSIQKIESARNLPITKIELMADALETTPAYLMGWQDESKELDRATKPLADFLVSHELSEDIKSLYETYDESEIKEAFKFLRAYLSASSERQKISLDILEPHPHDP